MRRGVLFALCVVLVVVLMNVSGVADTPSSESPSRNVWRLTIGGVMTGGVKTRVGVRPQRILTLSGFGRTIGRLERSARDAGVLRTKEEAYRLGSGEAADGKRIFDGGAWYDPKDSSGSYDDDWSWNWRLHDPSGLDPDGKAGFVERTAYYSEETVERYVNVSHVDMGNAEEDDFPGLRVEASRELFSSQVGKTTWGVDIAIAFAWFFERNAWKARGTAATATARGTRKSGYWEWWNDSNDEAQYTLDYYRDTQFDGSMWGSGSYEGPGAELSDSAWRVRDVYSEAETWSVAHRLRYDAKGDWHAYDLEFLVRPWWEPTDWLRLFGSVGFAAEHRWFEWSLDATGSDGTSYREHDTERDWCLLGLAGGGLALTWRDFSILGEILWRFGGDDLSIKGKTLSGHVTTGDWSARLGLGYGF